MAAIQVKMSYPNPIIDGMIKDMVRNICALKGVAYLEQEVAYYKMAQSFYSPVHHIAYALPGPPAISSAANEVIVVDPAPAPAPAPAPLPVAPPVGGRAEGPTFVGPVATIKTEKVIVVEPVPAPVPAAAETHTVTVQDRVRYKRTELPDERRCTAPTSRGSRCTLEREEKQAFCSRHKPRT